LSPALDINQYAHTAWTVRQGFFDGIVHAITQTQDGYLWLGTELGLVRFDGVRAVPWTFPHNQRLVSGSILSLLATRDGSLWIGTVDGLDRWQGGTLTHYPELTSQRIFALFEDHTGKVWAASFRPAGATLCEIRDRTAACVGHDGTFGPWVRAIYEDRDGRLWVHASTGLWQWTPGPPKRYPLPNASTWFQTSQPLVQGGTESELIFIAGGLRSFVEGRVTSYAVSDVPQPFTPLNLLRTRDGALWIGTLERGLVRIASRTTTMTRRDGLSSDHIFSSFQDREGNVWVGTAQGLDRFSELVATPIAVDQADPLTVLAARDGSAWIGTLNGLNRFHGSDVTTYRDREGLPGNSIGSLVEDDRGRVWVSTDRGIARFENGRFRSLRGVPAGWVNAITPDGGTGVWISDQDRGLLHVVDDAVVQQIPWSQLGGDGAVAAVLLADGAQGGLWLGFFRGGVVYLKDGQIEVSYHASDGLGRGRVMGLHLEPDGSVWAATENGLSRIADRRVVTLTTKNGLPCETVHWIVDDERASYWLYTACGLVQIPRRSLQKWVSDPTRTIEATVFDASDGVRSRALLTGFTPRVSKSSDGRLWFVNVEGVSVVDPRHLPINTMPPAVRIEQIAANQKTFDASAQIHLPGSIRDLEIDYTALSFVAPEKNSFRIKLEGYDRDWQDVGTRRQAFYTNLPSRQYRFRVAAANNSGVWNDAGAALDFTIAPAYYQTMWFRAVGLAGVCTLLWALHQLRLRQIASQYDARLQARLNERTRIARDLHDTLLQSLHGLMFRFQAVRNMLPRRIDEAIEVLDGAISRTGQAIAESRDAIQDLRSESLRHKTVGEMLAAFGQELASTQEASHASPLFRVTVEGKSLPLSANLHDEISRIARELLRNAFQHAHARQIEAEIRYDDHLLCLRVRDDGTGIDPPVLQQGQRAGHWGLRGVRERAQRIGAQLDIWSEANVGTEVQLRVPAGVAYDASRRPRSLRLFRVGRTHEPHR
jgi:signal transduction histidine kinase/ligand-binding sensor domain-containing protein